MLLIECLTKEPSFISFERMDAIQVVGLKDRGVYGVYAVPRVTDSINATGVLIAMVTTAEAGSDLVQWLVDRSYLGARLITQAQINDHLTRKVYA